MKPQSLDRAFSWSLRRAARHLPLMASLAAIGLAVACGSKDDKQRIGLVPPGGQPKAEIDAASAKYFKGFDSGSSSNQALSKRVEGASAYVKPSASASSDKKAFDVVVKILLDDEVAEKPAMKIISGGSTYFGLQNDIATTVDRTAKLNIYYQAFLTNSDESSPEAKNFRVRAFCDDATCSKLYVQLLDNSSYVNASNTAAVISDTSAAASPTPAPSATPAQASAPDSTKKLQPSTVIVFQRTKVNGVDAGPEVSYQIVAAAPISTTKADPKAKQTTDTYTMGTRNSFETAYKNRTESGLKISEPIPVQPLVPAQQPPAPAQNPATTAANPAPTAAAPAQNPSAVQPPPETPASAQPSATQPDASGAAQPATQAPADAAAETPSQN